jgi:hypothetical protein
MWKIVAFRKPCRLWRAAEFFEAHWNGYEMFNWESITNFISCCLVCGGSSVGIVRSRTKGHGVCFVCLFCCLVCIIAIIQKILITDALFASLEHNYFSLFHLTRIIFHLDRIACRDGPGTVSPVCWICEPCQDMPCRWFVVDAQNCSRLFNTIHSALYCCWFVAVPVWWGKFEGKDNCI